MVHNFFPMYFVNVLKLYIFDSIFLLPKFYFFIQLLIKILNGMANRSSLIWINTGCICHFVRSFGVRDFMTFTKIKLDLFYRNWTELAELSCRNLQ